MLNDFLYRIGQWGRENRARLIGAVLIAGGAIVLALLIRYGVERIQQWSYERGAAAKDQEFREADTKAKLHQARANALEAQIAAKDARIIELEKESVAAKVVYEKTRTVYLPLKETYEEARDNPDVPVDISCADACRELAAVEHPCR